MNLKRSIFMFLTFIILFAFNTAVFAEDTKIVKEVKGFEIMGGFSDKEVETTFDNTRTITGKAQKGTVITLILSRPNLTFDETLEENEDNLRFFEEEIDSFTVGSLGFFSKSITLYEGDNTIIVIAQKDANESVRKCTINYMNIDDMFQIGEKGIILPGKSIEKAKQKQ